MPRLAVFIAFQPLYLDPGLLQSLDEFCLRDKLMRVHAESFCRNDVLLAVVGEKQRTGGTI
jgi:hypothetical protein